MRAILYCSERSTRWAEEFFPNADPYLLKFGNKPYLEFLTDFCVLVGIYEIRIVSDSSTSSLMDHMGDGSKYGVEFSYALASGNESIPSIVEKNLSFATGDDLFVFSGFLCLEYDKDALTPLPSLNGRSILGKINEHGEGWCVIDRNSLTTCDPVFHAAPLDDATYVLNPIDSILMFYEENMRLVYDTSAHYSLPGYGDHTDFMIGQNVVIPKKSHLRTPVILGNSIQFNNGTRIGPGVVIGDNVLVDSKATLSNTVVMGNSYIGQYSEMVGKIVYRNHVIDPKLGISLDIVDEFLLTELVRSGYWICPWKQRFVALILLILGALPYLFLRCLIRIRKTPVDCYMNQQCKRKMVLSLYLEPPTNYAGVLFRKLLLDRYHLLPLVIAGKLRLIGSYILLVNQENKTMLKSFPDYAPGIFSYSEYLGSENDPFQREIDELYYIHNTNFLFNMRILCGIWIRNFMKSINT